MLLLLNPPFFNKKQHYLLYYKEGPYPHPSLAYLAGYLQLKNIPVQIMDCKFHGIDTDELLRRLKKLKPKIIGIPSNTTEIYHVQRLISRIKEKLPTAFIILGGPHGTALPMQTINENKDLDAVVIGEGEQILEKLVSREDVFDTLDEINGIFYHDKKGEIKQNSLQSYGSHIYDYGKAAFHLWPNANLYYVMTYRGCPFPCSFCFRTVGKKIRLRKIEDVIAEVEYVACHSRKGHFWFMDATFGLVREHTIEILEYMNRNGLAKKVNWSCSTRVNVIDEDLLTLMKKAGCVNIGFGLESGSEKTLKSSMKNTSLSEARKAVKIAKKIGLRTSGFYIFGHINETKEDIKKTLQMVYRLNTDDAVIGIMTPWPGTKVYN